MKITGTTNKTVPKAPPPDRELMVFKVNLDPPGHWSFPRAHLAAVHCWFNVRLECTWPTSTVVVVCGDAHSLLLEILRGKIFCLWARHPLPPGTTLARTEFPTVLAAAGGLLELPLPPERNPAYPEAAGVHFIEVIDVEEAGS
jgi:hypothetical protein